MSRDTMYFPKTVEEFMEQYKMTDTKEVYSNGTEFVPIYRMKQWFEHERQTVKHGKWGRYGKTKHKIICTNCGSPRPYRKTETGYFVAWDAKCCPNCGEKMDLEE